jgi:hypothetical protein
MGFYLLKRVNFYSKLLQPVSILILMLGINIIFIICVFSAL